MPLTLTRIQFVALVVASIAASSNAEAAILLSSSSYSQTFDSYRGTTATIPEGWVTAGDLIYYNGSPNDGNAQNGVFTAGSSLYNTASGWYAMNSTADPTDYAFGLRTQTSSTSSLTAQFVNGTGGSLSDFTVNWDFEQYSEGYGNGRVSLLWSTDGTNFSAMNLSGGIVQTGVFGASPPVVYTTPKITDLTASLQYDLAPGDSLYIRFLWNSSKSGNQPHIAIDNFQLTAVPESSTVMLLSVAGILFGLMARRRLIAKVGDATHPARVEFK